MDMGLRALRLWSGGICVIHNYLEMPAAFRAHRGDLGHAQSAGLVRVRKLGLVCLCDIVMAACISRDVFQWTVVLVWVYGRNVRKKVEASSWRMRRIVHLYIF